MECVILYLTGMIYHISQHFRGESEIVGGKISFPNSSEINTDTSAAIVEEAMNRSGQLDILLPKAETKME